MSISVYDGTKYDKKQGRMVFFQIEKLSSNKAWKRAPKLIREAVKRNEKKKLEKK